MERLKKNLNFCYKILQETALKNPLAITNGFINNKNLFNLLFTHINAYWHTMKIKMFA